MRALVNDLLRRVISYCIAAAGLLLNCWQHCRIHRFAANQTRLKQKYGLTRNTPLLSYGEEIKNLIAAAAARAGSQARFALTSGSAADPKRILYTPRRLRALKFVFSDMFARACLAFRIKRTSLYVFSSFESDESLTSILLEEIDLPNYFTTLQAPYRVQHHPAMRALAAEYGATAVRLWIIAIANPGVLYSTNPSTISTFFDELTSQWAESSRLVRTWCKDPKRFNSDIRKIARRLDSRGSQERLHAISKSIEPLPIDTWAPALEAYICWTGGYVKPFLERLEKYLPSPRYRLIPMYSMSTETLETISHFDKNDVFFIPMADGVVYEFVEDSVEQHVVGPTELRPGKLYEMIVSDAYGLRRYRTGDLFRCRRKIKGLPDLVFVRRKGLEYSFTGEKLTAEQVSTVFEQLRRQYPALVSDKYLTCVPSQAKDATPHYKVLLIGERNRDTHLDLLAARCDELLSELNCEYRNKRATGRLGAVRFVETGTKEFGERYSPNGVWESQFKFLPLCPHLTWNDPQRVS